MVTFYPSHPEAREDAAARRLREKVLCFVVRGDILLVFAHVGVPGAGVQVPAGGVESGESPPQAGVRELREESGLRFTAPRFLVSYRWEAPLPERFTRQVCHAYAFTAPPATPDTWEHGTDGHRFSFRWTSLAAPTLDWEMDAALPWLMSDLATPPPTPAQEIPA